MEGIQKWFGIVALATWGWFAYTRYKTQVDAIVLGPAVPPAGSLATMTLRPTSVCSEAVNPYISEMAWRVYSKSRK